MSLRYPVAGAVLVGPATVVLEMRIEEVRDVLEVRVEECGSVVAVPGIHWE